MREVGGRYTLVRRLGHGGMGEVWLGHDTVLDRDVAVKQLLIPADVPLEERDEYRTRVLREAHTASKLTHPGVVTIHDLVKEGDDQYIVMERILGPTLLELVERAGPLSVRRTAELARDLLAALQAAHNAEIVHRDVKPSNVMLAMEGSVKLTDFGIAQSYEDSRITVTGEIVGSPAYMSPERLRGGEPSLEWDLWALGATLYYAVEGHDAFVRPTAAETILAVVNERPLMRRCHGPLAELINGLLERDLELRIRPAQARRLIDRALAPDDCTPAAGVITVPPQPLPVPPPVRQFSGHPDRVQLTVFGRVIASVAAAGILLAFIFLVARDPRQTRSSSGGSSSTALPAHTFTIPTVPSSTTTTPTTSTSTTVTMPSTLSRAMRPMLTFGPGGDIPDLAMPADGCFRWVPRKGGPAPKPSDQASCSKSYLVQEFVRGEFSHAEADLPYPSDDELHVVAKDCDDDFMDDSFIPLPAKEDALRYWVLVPSTQAWQVRTVNGRIESTRYFVCLVGKADGSALSQSLIKG